MYYLSSTTQKRDIDNEDLLSPKLKLVFQSAHYTSLNDDHSTHEFAIMSTKLTRQEFINIFFAIAVSLYIVGAILIVDYFPH
jgi:hypothetical protein